MGEKKSTSCGKQLIPYAATKVKKPRPVSLQKHVSMANNGSQC